MPLTDPGDPGQIHDALLAYLHRHLGGGVEFAEQPAPMGRGFDTFIYTFALRGVSLDEVWAQPLVLRVYSTIEQAAKAEREAAVQAFAFDHGYPALAPVAIEPANPELGLPVMIMRRIAGGALLEGITSKPWRARRLLSGMADVHAQLHALPTDGCPLPYDSPLVDRKLLELRQRIDELGVGHMEEGYRWLEERKGTVTTEDVALCHNDFHPLNILEGPRDVLTVIDWSDAALGDRHCDVARTVGVIWFAQIAATSALERTLLKLARGFLRGTYLNRYNALMPLDPRRLAYWEALHTFSGWGQLEDVAAGAARGDHQTEMAQQIPAGTLALARDRFWKLAGAFR